MSWNNSKKWAKVLNLGLSQGRFCFAGSCKAGNPYLVIILFSSGRKPATANSSGHFELPSLTGNTIFYIDIQRGDCISQRVPVSVKVVDASLALLPNAFTPNGEGKNDSWGVAIIGIIELRSLRVFNR